MTKATWAIARSLKGSLQVPDMRRNSTPIVMMTTTTKATTIKTSVKAIGSTMPITTTLATTDPIRRFTISIETMTSPQGTRSNSGNPGREKKSESVSAQEKTIYVPPSSSKILRRGPLFSRRRSNNTVRDRKLSRTPPAN